VIGDIRDQSNCGCCWAFAGASAASDRMCIATKGELMAPRAASASGKVLDERNSFLYACIKTM